jgi:phosphoribosylformylglycinamidine synthase
MHRIYVKYTIPDSRAKVKKNQFETLGLKNKLGAVCLAECYTIDANLNQKQIAAAKNLLANPLAQSADTTLSFPRNFNYAVEIGFLPGVTDNIGNTAKETLADGAKVKFKGGENVYFSAIYFVSFIPKRSVPIYGRSRPPINRHATSNDITKIANSLYNPLIQRASVKSREEFIRDGGLDVYAPKVKLTASSKVSLVDLNVSDEELIKIGKLGIMESADKSARYIEKRRGPLALGVAELKVIRDYFNKLQRKPTDIELETLAQTWSEHCKHTIFADPMDELEKGLYKTYIKGATEKIRKQKSAHREDDPLAARGSSSRKGDFCVSVFTDNAGGIIFDKDYIVSHKVETHNTPSALDPFGGAITGIVGVNRDVLGFGLGAKPIANFYGFCLAEPNDKTALYRDKNLQQPMLSARRIMDGVISGINSGGNQSGIPTPLGFLNFDSRYRGKPLVFAGTVGLSPKKIGSRLSWQKKALPGDYIVVVGGRVGADGIHGATFSSEGLDKDSPATAVQIGDPITQKKLSDAIVKEARGQNLYNSITDCGAGGLSSAVGEMASQAGDPSGSSRAKSRGGCEVLLDKVPLKYPGLAPWQIWISESQERMVLSVPPKRWPKFQKLMEKRGVEATVIGKFTKSGNCTVKYGNRTVLDMEMEFLHDGRPVKNQKTEKPRIFHPERSEAKSRGKKDYSDQILKLLQSPNIASTEFVNQQYDHEVQASSVLKPLQGRGKINSEASVIKPVLTSKKALVLSYGLNPSLSELDAYNMAASGIDSAVRAAVAAGANIDYMALLDNFCWCSSEDPHRLWQLKEACRACFDTATAYGTPFISGKDSMYNDFKGFSDDGKPIKISIPPTLLISTISVIPEAEKTVSLDAKLPGDLLYILGTTNDEMGGSEYQRMQSPLLSKEGYPAQRDGLPSEALAKEGVVPAVNAAKNYLLYKTLFTAIQKNLIASSISINRGGLAVGLMKKLMGGQLGAEINLNTLPGNWKENYQALFSESQGRILVSVDPKRAGEFEKLMSGNAIAKIGIVTSKPTITIANNNKTIVNLKTSDALKAYKSTFKDY